MTRQKGSDACDNGAAEKTMLAAILKHPVKDYFTEVKYRRAYYYSPMLRLEGSAHTAVKTTTRITEGRE